MPSRCSILKAKVSSRQICKSPLPSILVFLSPKSQVIRERVWNPGGWQPSLLSAQNSSQLSHLGLSAPISVWKCTGV